MTHWNDPKDDAPQQTGASYARQWLRTDEPSVIEVRRVMASLERRIAKPAKDSPDARRRKQSQDNFDRSYVRVLSAWLEQEHGIT